MSRSCPSNHTWDTGELYCPVCNYLATEQPSVTPAERVGLPSGELRVGEFVFAPQPVAASVERSAPADEPCVPLESLSLDVRARAPFLRALLTHLAQHAPGDIPPPLSAVTLSGGDTDKPRFGTTAASRRPPWSTGRWEAVGRFVLESLTGLDARNGLPLHYGRVREHRRTLPWRVPRLDQAPPAVARDREPWWSWRYLVEGLLGLTERRFGKAEVLAWLEGRLQPPVLASNGARGAWSLLSLRDWAKVDWAGAGASLTPVVLRWFPLGRREPLAALLVDANVPLESKLDIVLAAGFPDHRLRAVPADVPARVALAQTELGRHIVECLPDRAVAVELAAARRVMVMLPRIRAFGVDFDEQRAAALLRTVDPARLLDDAHDFERRVANVVAQGLRTALGHRPSLERAVLLLTVRESAYETHAQLTERLREAYRQGLALAQSRAEEAARQAEGAAREAEAEFAALRQSLATGRGAPPGSLTAV